MKNCLFLITLIFTLTVGLFAREKPTEKEKPKPTINISALIHTDLIYDVKQMDPALLDVKSKEVLPDFITRYTRKGAWGYTKWALLLRQLSYEIVSIEFERAVSRSKFGWGVNLTSTIRVFKKQGSLKLQSVFGRGYAGYNNDGGVEIETHRAVVPFQHGFVVACDHFINDKWQASVVYSETNQTNSAGLLLCIPSVPIYGSVNHLSDYPGHFYGGIKLSVRYANK